MKLALFDLDHTLLNTDSDYSWGEFLVNQGLVDPVRHRQMNDQFYADYKAGQLDPIAYNEFVFEFLTQHEPDYLTELHELFMQKSFVRRCVQPVLKPLHSIKRPDMNWWELLRLLILLRRQFSVNLVSLKLLPPMRKCKQGDIPVK